MKNCRLNDETSLPGSHIKKEGNRLLAYRSKTPIKNQLQAAKA